MNRQKRVQMGKRPQGAQMAEKGEDKTSHVDKQRVACENCRFQFTFLYDRKKGSENIPAEMESRNDLAALKARYADLHTCYRPCPHCGFAQNWMVRAKRWARIQDYGYIGLCLGILLSLASLVVMLFAGMSSSGTTLMTFAGFGKLFILAVTGYLLFGTFYVPYVSRVWAPNKNVDRSRYEATRPVDVDDEQRQRSIQEYRQAAKTVSRLGLTQKVSPEPRLSARGKGLIFASCALAVLAFLSPALFPDMVATLNANGLIMLPFYVGIVFLLITTIGGSWRFIYKMIL